jgi:hypothetical protein
MSTAVPDHRQADLLIPKPKPPTAAEKIERYLLGILPPGTPPSYVAITDARSRWDGRKHTLTAELTLIDGDTCTVEVVQWQRGGILWNSHSYPRWNGPALYWDGHQWVRDAKEGTGNG